MTIGSFAPHKIGVSLVRILGMRMPDDPMLQRTQASFAALQLAAALAAMAQALVILASEGLALVSTQYRIGNNLMLSVFMLIALLGFTARAKLHAAAAFVSVGILLYDLIFAVGFGLRTTPTPTIVTISLLGAVALVEPPRRIALWATLISIAFGIGIAITPLWEFAPSPASFISVVVFTVAFFAVVLIEFRQSMLSAMKVTRDQASALSIANLELQQSLMERNDLSEKLATAERLEAMGSMAGNIVHDFSNMLTVIRGYSDRISDEITATSPHRDEVDQLVRAVTRATNVSRDVLDFANPIAFAFAPVDMAQFLRTLSPRLIQIAEPRVRLQFAVPDSVGSVSADVAQLERVFLNLVTNAADATPHGGTVTINLTAADDRILCKVTDEGRGVPASQRERIFEPFFTTKGTTGGGGLGLASSYAIVRQHYGFITVDDAPNGGAEFTVDLPRSAKRVALLEAAPVETAKPSSTVKPPTDKPLANVTVLLVEDDEPLRRLVVRMLQRAGAAVHAMDSGIDAVNHLHESRMHGPTPFDVVVTDLRLPEGSGGEVISAAMRASENIALVALSGFLEDASVANLAAQNKVQFLSKPFAEPQLMEAIRTARRYADRRG